MDTLPIFTRLGGRACLVVGGGPVAAGKAGVLVQAGGVVTVVAPALVETLRGELDRGTIRWRARRYASADLDGQWLVIAATDDAALNTAIVRDADARGLLANAASDGSAGNFIMPAIVDRSPVLAAVSTGGASPVLARLVRARLEAVLPPLLGRLAELSRAHREAVKARFAAAPARRAFWDRVFTGPIATLVFDGRMDDAHDAMAAALAAPGGAVGEVHFIDARAGDPDLLTVRDTRLLGQADVIVYDPQVPQPILDRVRRDARRVPATGDDVPALLTHEVRAGHRVARLFAGARPDDVPTLSGSDRPNPEPTL